MLNIKKTFLFVLCVFLPVSGLYAANIATQYGLIQNVGNYASIPGWRPDAPYNQTFPRPVYVNGTDLKTDDCQRAVSAVIESYCGSHDGCSGVRLVDVRGDLLTQLARLPGHAFATACAGFVDTMFDEYIANRPLQQAAFPVATGGVSNNTTTTPTFTEPTMPNWQAEYIDRVNELAELQAQNAAGTGVNPDNFPKTFSDLSFEERNAILAQGYEPYKDKSAYTPIEVEDLKRTSASGTTPGTSTGGNSGGGTNNNGGGVESVDPIATPTDEFNSVGIFVWNPTKNGQLKDYLNAENEIVRDSLPTDYWWDRYCSDWLVAFNIDDDAPINVAGNKVFGETNMSDYFIDFPKSKHINHFPGLILKQSGARNRVYLMSGTKEKLEKTLRDFVETVKSASSASNACSGLVFSLIQVDSDYKPKSVKILQGIQGLKIE